MRMIIDMFEALGIVLEVLAACFSSANYTDLQHITLIGMCILCAELMLGTGILITAKCLIGLSLLSKL